MCRELGLPKELVLHSTRHTAASKLGAAGVSPFVLCKLMGWSNIQMAQRYCHPDRAQMETAIGLLEAR